MKMMDQIDLDGLITDLKSKDIELGWDAANLGIIQRMSIKLQQKQNEPLVGNFIKIN